MKLYYFFWGAAEAEVNKKKPKTIYDLKKVVEDYKGHTLSG